MFDILDRIKEAWDNSKFIIIFDSEKRENECDMVIPSQIVRYDHIAELRVNAGGLICTALSPEYAKNIGLPYLDVVYHGIESRYPLISQMLSHELPLGAKSSFSLSVNHINAHTGITDKDRALTISEIGNLADEFQNGSLRKQELLMKFGATFRIPGHVPLLKASTGLLKKRLGHTELSIALCDLTKHAPSATFAEIMDSKTGKALSLQNAKNFAEKNDIPLIDGRTIINLWRSIKKIPKDKIASFKG